MASAYFHRGSIIESLTSTATSGGNLALTNASDHYQILTGTLSHTVTLPDATTLVQGLRYEVTNASTQDITVNDFGGTLLGTVASGATRIFRVTDISTSNGSWDVSVATSSGTGLSAVEAAQLAAGSAKGFTAQSRVLKLNPENLTGNFWSAISSLPSARQEYPGFFALNGYGYIFGGQNGTNLATALRYSDDNNYLIGRTSMNTARAYAGSVTVGSLGYAINGENAASAETNDLEAYDDTLNTWTTKASNTVTRQDATPSSPWGSLIYVTGGRITGVETTRCDIYNTVLNSWVQASFVLPAARGLTKTFVFQDRLVLPGGNNGGAQSTVYSIYPETNTVVTETNSLPVATRYASTSTINDTGYFYLGGNTVPADLNTSYQYDRFTKTFQSKATLATAKGSSGCGALNGSPLSFGGRTSGTTESQKFTPFSVFSLGSLKISTAVPTSIAVSALLNNLAPNIQVQLRTDGDSWKSFMSGGSVLKNGEAVYAKFKEYPLTYVAGGDISGAATTTVNEYYNESANSWTSRQALPTAISAPGGGFSEGEGYQFGGDNFTAYQTVARKYNDTTDSWSSVASLSTQKAYPSSFSVDQSIYLCGGLLQGNTTGQTTVERYNKTLNTYSAMTGLGTASVIGSGFELNGRGYVAGGSTNNTGANAQSTVQKYTVELNSWANVQSSSSSRQGQGSIAINGLAFTLGGQNSAGTNQSLNEKYNDVLNTMTSVTGMSTVRNGLQVSRLSATILAISGTAGGFLNTTEHYNPSTDSWTGRANIGTARRYLLSGFAANTFRNYELRLCVPAYYAGVGGRSWITKSSMTTGQSPSVPFTIGAKLYGSAGFSQSSGGNRDNIGQYYDSIIDTWYRDVNYPISVSGASSPGSSSTALTGRGFGFGGDNGASFVNSYSYDPDAHTWNSIANLPATLTTIITFALNGLLYLSNAAGESTVTRSYSPATNSYTSKASSGSSHQYGNGGPLNGFGYVTGSGLPSITAVHEQYNDASNSWLTKTAMTAARELSGLMILPDGYTMAGGYNGSPTATNYVYKDAANIWVTAQSFPSGSVYEPACGTINENGILAGGYDGSVYTTLTRGYVDSVKQAVLSAGLTVS